MRTGTALSPFADHERGVLELLLTAGATLREHVLRTASVGRGTPVSADAERARPT
jgi:hypothetical protein